MLKKIAGVLVAFMLALSPNLWAKNPGKMFSGKELSEYCNGKKSSFSEGVCAGFVVGIHDRLSGNKVCKSPNINIGDLMSIVKNFLNENPQNLIYTAESIVENVLVKYFPCK